MTQLLPEGTFVLINVSTLLSEPLGSTRDYRPEHELVSVSDEGYERHVSGRVHLIRSRRGVLVGARLAYDVPATCARCAREFPLRTVVEFDEEYVQVDDPNLTTRDTVVDPDDFVIDEHRHLDLSEAVRQYELSALLLHPLCRPDCRGLCAICGTDLNESSCSCGTAGHDARWGALGTLAERLRTGEDAHGGSEA